MSYGNDWAEFEFKSGASLLTGPSGNGKSAITEAVFYALFGAPYRKGTKGKLVNNINQKLCETELYLKKDNTEYKIVRGMKPDKLELYNLNKSDTEQENKNISIREFQEYMETLLGVDKKLFQQIVMIDSMYFKPFLSLSLAEKRHIIDKVFGIDSLQELNVNLKVVETENKGKIADLEKNKSFVNEKIELNKELEKKNSQEQIKGIKTYITECTDYIEKQKKELGTEEERLYPIKTKVQILKDGLVLNQDKKIKVDKDIDDLKEKKYKIYGEIDTKYADKFKDNNKQIMDLNEKINDLDRARHTKIDEIKKEYRLKYEECDGEKQKLNKEIDGYSYHVQTYKSEYELAQSGKCPTCGQVIADADKKVEDIKNKVAEIKQTVVGLKEKIGEIQKQKDVACEFERNKIILAETNNDKEKYKIKDSITLIKKQNDDIEIEKSKEKEKAVIDTDKDIKSKQDLIIDINKEINDIKSQIEKEKDIYDSIKNGVTRIEQNIENKKSDISRSEKQIEGLRNKKVECGKVKELEEELAVIQKDIDAQTEEANIIAIMKNILSDNGIRKYIVAQYLPLLNDYIKEYMGLMEMDCFFQLDDSFDEITNTGRTNTIDYEFASQGETVRINFCIMLAFIKIAEKRCGNRIVNLIIDEAISSLDEVNAGLLLEIITKYLNKTVLVISHNPDIKDYFENVYFIKKNRFSEICEE